MTSRMLDVRRTFVLGISMVFGLSVDMIPGLYQRVPAMLQPIFSSEVALATVLVVVLNLLFRIGVAKSHTLQVPADASQLHETITTFMEERGGAWGMRKEVEERAAETIYELLLSVRTQPVTSPVHLRVRFDELSLDADVEYRGTPVQLPETPPSLDQISASGAGIALLSGYIVRQRADRVSVNSTPDGRCCVRLHFEH
jgi:NCS2 family nucleobase:cation symporter-2